MFAFMRQEKQGLTLSNVTFWVRDWTRMNDRPWNFPEWLEGKRAKVVCTTDGDEEKDEGWCDVEAGEEYWTNEGYLGHFEY